MLNVGLKSGRRAAAGYGTTPELLMDYIHTHATKEHWNYVEGVWKVFEDIKKAEDARDLRLQGLLFRGIWTANRHSIRHNSWKVLSSHT